MRIKIFTDGGARGNPGPAACAFVATGDAGNMLEKRGKSLGVQTNNVAEYEGVLLALGWILSNLRDLSNLSEIQFFLDSNLVVNQLNGIFKVKEGSLKELFAKIKHLESEIDCSINYTFVRREHNFEADKLVNETLDQDTSRTS